MVGCRPTLLARRLWSDGAMDITTHMRRLLTAACALLAVTTASPAQAQEMRLLRNLPSAASAFDGRYVDGFFFTNTLHELQIYDARQPADPKLVGRLSTGEYLMHEGLDTDGKTLLLPVRDELWIVDVTDKAAPKVRSKVSDYAGTWTCLDSCRYAYSSGIAPLGVAPVVYDLLDPAAPRRLGAWAGGLETSGPINDVTDLGGGRALVVANPLMVVDFGRDPLRPRVELSGETPVDEIQLDAVWPRGGADRFGIAGGEFDGPDATCANPNTVYAFDGKAWKQTGKLTATGTYRVPSSGVSPVGCSTHRFDVNPGFHNRGWVALAALDNGLRLLEVAADGALSERGKYTPGGFTSSADWVTDSIVYVVDGVRGLDVLEVKLPEPAKAAGPAKPATTPQDSATGSETKPSPTSSSSRDRRQVRKACARHRTQKGARRRAVARRDCRRAKDRVRGGRTKRRG